MSVPIFSLWLIPSFEASVPKFAPLFLGRIWFEVDAAIVTECDSRTMVRRLLAFPGGER